jgi:hypothetical protein
MITVKFCEDPRRVTEPVEIVYRGTSERDARRAAANALGCATLRGLAQCPSQEGVCYAAPGHAGDEDGAPFAEIAWT